MTRVHEIIPNLYLGNKDIAVSAQFLRRKHIELIVNCTKDQPFQRHWRNIEHFQVPIDDKLAMEDNVRLLQLVPMIIQKINSYLMSGRSVLVHCYAGIQRSATVVACYLMFQHGLTAEEAVAFIQSRRPVAFQPRANFWWVLERFEQELKRIS